MFQIFLERGNLTVWDYLWISNFEVHECTLESSVVSFEMSFLGSSPRDSNSKDQGWGLGIWIFISTWYGLAEAHTLRNTEEVISKVNLYFSFLESFIYIESIFVNPCQEYEQSNFLMTHIGINKKIFMKSGFLLWFQIWKKTLKLKYTFSM